MSKTSVLNYRAFLLKTVGSIVNRRPQALAISYDIAVQDTPNHVFDDIRKLVEETTMGSLTVRRAAPELAVSAYWMVLVAGATNKLSRDPQEIVRRHSPEHQLFGIVQHPLPRCVKARKTTDELRSLKERQAATQRRIREYQTNSAAASDRLFRRMIAQLKKAIESHPDPVVRRDAAFMLNRLSLHECKLVDLLTLGDMLGYRLPIFSRADH